MIGELINAGANLIGGIFNRDAQATANENARYQAAIDRDLQKEFAQHAIQWKVSDARAAGVSPYAALGVPGASSTPISIGSVPETGIGDALSSMGANLGNVANKVSTGGQRADDFTQKLQSLQLTRAGLENEKLASEIATMKGSAPPFPSATGATNDPTSIAGRANPGVAGKALDHVYDASSIAVGKDFPKNPWHSDAQKYEDRYGDLVENAAGLKNLIADWLYANPSAGPWMRGLTGRKEGLSSRERSF